MKLDAHSKYKCQKCKKHTFAYDTFSSKWNNGFNGYHNVASGECQECGWKGEFATVNKEKHYEKNV